jgi:hypothetical protein
MLEWVRAIADDVLKMRNADRATIIFFEDEQHLREFKKQLPSAVEGGDGIATFCAEVTEGNVEYINHYVKEATNPKAVTLFPRVFGRGLDFKCYDPALNARGGVHVIQTFLSEDISEEIQIKGRTCRQGESGSYTMILLATDLMVFPPSRKKPASRLESTHAVCRAEGIGRAEGAIHIFG